MNFWGFEHRWKVPRFHHHPRRLPLPNGSPHSIHPLPPSSPGTRCTHRLAWASHGRVMAESWHRTVGRPAGRRRFSAGHSARRPARRRSGRTDRRAERTRKRERERERWAGEGRAQGASKREVSAHESARGRSGCGCGLQGGGKGKQVVQLVTS